MKENEIMDLIVRSGLRIQNILGQGFTTEIYKNAFLVEMDENGIKYENNRAFQVKYKDKLVGEFLPDVVVDKRVIVKISTNHQIEKQEEVEVKNYLRASGLKHGIILNFDASFEFRKIEF